MAVKRGMLGQAAPTLDTDTDLYTVPTSRNAVVKVIATNRSGATTFRVWVAVAGVATEDKQYEAFEKPLAGNDAVATISFMIGPTDVVRVRAASSNVSFSCTGIEQDE